MVFIRLLVNVVLAGGSDASLLPGRARAGTAGAFAVAVVAAVIGRRFHLPASVSSNVHTVSKLHSFPW